MFGSTHPETTLASNGSAPADVALGPYSEPESRLSDRDIRLALIRGGPSLLRDGDCVMEELRCWRGYVRADYLVASERSLSIVEIKSDRDTLSRLAEQTRVYSSIADRVILVVGWALAAQALRAVPWWWEVWLAERPPKGDTRLVLLRDGSHNPDVSPSSLAAMLPVHEARRVALGIGLPPVRRRSDELRRSLVNHLTSAELRAAIVKWLVRISHERHAQLS